MQRSGSTKSLLFKIDSTVTEDIIKLIEDKFENSVLEVASGWLRVNLSSCENKTFAQRALGLGLGPKEEFIIAEHYKSSKGT